MRRKLLFLLFFCIATIAKAENEPVITLNVEVNEAKITLGFEVSTPNTKLSIDWGDGVLVETCLLYTSKLTKQHVIIVGTKEMCFTQHAFFMIAITNLILILK